jgi:hypothetical protein
VPWWKKTEDKNMATIQLTVPDCLDKICTWPVMAYRLLKYGYPFRRIYLGEGEWTILDSQDYYRFGNLKWFVSGNGSNLYAARSFKTGPLRTTITHLHRQIMNPPPGLLVDHRNCNSLDNRRANLRLATHQENMRNRRKRKNTSSRFIGVTFDKQRGKWLARIIYQGKRIFLGRFDTEIEAARAYDAAVKKYHIEFARLNFPENT